MATIVHFDITADNIERAQKFYSALFNWKFNPVPGPVPYYLIETKDLQGNAGTGGGMAKRTDPQQPGITNFIGVASLDESIAKVKELGGTIIGEKQTLPGFGFLAVCLDTENNPVGLFEENSENGQQNTTSPGNTQQASRPPAEK